MIIIGTSRGAISAMALSPLADAIVISSPVTRSGKGGHPVGMDGSSFKVQVSSINVPILIPYHEKDGCLSTRPSNTVALFNSFQDLEKDVTLHAFDGGFNDVVNFNVCEARSYHGFLGIESPVVGHTTAWIDEILEE